MSSLCNINTKLKILLLVVVVVVVFAIASKKKKAALGCCGGGEGEGLWLEVKLHNETMSVPATPIIYGELTEGKPCLLLIQDDLFFADLASELSWMFPAPLTIPDWTIIRIVTILLNKHRINRFCCWGGKKRTTEVPVVPPQQNPKHSRQSRHLNGEKISLFQSLPVNSMGMKTSVTDFY